MNILIRTLAEQDGCAYWNNENLRDMSTCQAKMQKFAGLVIQTCGRIADQFKYDHYDRDISYMIDQHFGIEE
jgi:hypothetical protein